MASKKIKAEVYVNEPVTVGYRIVELNLTDAQATDVLESVVAGEVLVVNLLTGSRNGHAKENPAAYAEQ